MRCKWVCNRWLVSSLMQANATNTAEDAEMEMARRGDEEAPGIFAAVRRWCPAVDVAVCT